MKRTIGAAVIALSSLVMLGVPAMAETKAPPDPAVAMLTQPELMDQLFQPFGETIRQVDPSVVKVVVFRETRQDRYPELNTLIENRVTDELIRSNRFKVVECRECRTPRVVSDEKSFSYSNTIESNARLAEIGTRLGVDGVLMWSTMGTGKNVIVNFKMVRANDGAVVWSKHFQTEPDRSAQEEKRRQQEEEARFRDSGFYSYLGMSGFNTTRVSTSDDKTANPDAFEKMGLGVGGILLRNSSFLDNFAYGLEANFTSAAGLNLNSTFGVVTAEPFFLLAIDPLLFKESKNRVFNLYAAVGPTVALGKTPVTLISSKAGLMFKPTPDLFLNVGFVNVPTNTIDLQAKNNFQSTEQFGGFVWDVGMGIVFKP